MWTDFLLADISLHCNGETQPCTPALQAGEKVSILLWLRLVRREREGGG